MGMYGYTDAQWIAAKEESEWFLSLEQEMKDNLIHGINERGSLDRFFARRRCVPPYAR